MTQHDMDEAGSQTAEDERAALVVVDVQHGFADESFWGRRNNPGCEDNIGLLLARWRERGWPVVLVRHDSSTDGSPLEAGTPGNQLRDVVEGPHDLLVTKQVNSAFHGSPDLAGWLNGQGIRRVVICGVTTNHCCETTARVGGNLGFDVWFPLDATHTFDRRSPSGELITADELVKVTATNLHDEFATVCATSDLVG
ncbi:MAG TPA: cysteine hydrolase family protein [Nocardioides sp.]|nr:cysteine hydrolase family protein [Nocardioides sp.]